MSKDDTHATARATPSLYATTSPSVKAAAPAPATAPTVQVGTVVHHVNAGGECEAAIVTGFAPDGSTHLTAFPASGGGAGGNWRSLPWSAEHAAHTWHAADHGVA